jgi:protein-S-isoprenylcysteine O-methyltransferase Ste14
MKLLLALITIMLWPVIPLFWLPVHLLPAMFRRMGRATYFIVPIVWLPIAYFIYLNRAIIFRYLTEFPPFISIAGLLLLMAGSLLHIWTGALLSPRSLIGIPEIIAPEESRLTDKGPFSVVRHPTYLAHTMMFLGVFLFTGVVAAGLLTLVDFVVVSAFVIPLEEKELLQRFGNDYREYMNRVPRLLPHISRKK